MTPIGHSLIGMSFGVLAMPRGATPVRRCLCVAGFVLLANVPDLPLPGWGHEQYEISHSLIVNGTLILMIACALRVLARTTGYSWNGRLVMAAALVWLSHLVIDATYRHGLGLAVLWPLSNDRLYLPLHWFEIYHVGQPPWSEQNLSVLLTEVGFCLPLLGLALVLRYRWRTAEQHK